VLSTTRLFVCFSRNFTPHQLPVPSSTFFRKPLLRLTTYVHRIASAEIGAWRQQRRLIIHFLKYAFFFGNNLSQDDMPINCVLFVSAICLLKH
jgi:hypothetical protein